MLEAREFEFIAIENPLKRINECFCHIVGSGSFDFFDIHSQIEHSAY